MRLLKNRIIMFIITFPIFLSNAQNYFCVEYIGIDHFYENICDYEAFENLLNEKTCEYYSFSVDDTTSISRITYLLKSCGNCLYRSCVYPSAICYWYNGDSLVNMYEVGIEYFRNIKENEVYRIPWEVWQILKKNIPNNYETKMFELIDRYVKQGQVKNECDDFVFKRRSFSTSNETSQ